MANESTQWLYDQLTKKGYNVGKDINEFDSLMQNNAESRQWAFDTARKQGLNVGKDFDEFTSLVAPQGAAQRGREGAEIADVAKAGNDKGAGEQSAPTATASADQTIPGGLHLVNRGWAVAPVVNKTNEADEPIKTATATVVGPVWVSQPQPEGGSAFIRKSDLKYPAPLSENNAPKEKSSTGSADKGMIKNSPLKENVKIKPVKGPEMTGWEGYAPKFSKPDGTETRDYEEAQTAYENEGLSYYDKVYKLYTGTDFEKEVLKDDPQMKGKPEARPGYQPNLEDLGNLLTLKWGDFKIPEGWFGLRADADEPMVYGSPIYIGKDKDGKEQWMGADGTVTTDRNAVMEYNEAVQHYDKAEKFYNRMKDNGLNVDKEEDQYVQALYDSLHDNGSYDEGLKELKGLVGKYGLDANNLDHLRWVVKGDVRKILEYAEEKASKELNDLHRYRDNYLQRQIDKMPWYEKVGAFFSTPAGAVNYTDPNVGSSSSHKRSPYDDEIAKYTAIVMEIDQDLTEYDMQTAASKRSGFMGGLLNLATGLYRGVTNPNTWTMGFWNASINDAAKRHSGVNAIKELSQQYLSSAPNAGVAYNGGRFAGELVGDPSNLVFFGVGGAAGSTAKGAVAEMAARRGGASLTADAALRLGNQSLVNRMGLSAIEKGTELAMFNAMSNSRDQILNGGWTDENGVFHEGFSATEVLKSTGEGAVLGAALGPFAEITKYGGNVAVSAIDRNFGKFGTGQSISKGVVRAAEKGTSFIGESTIWSVPNIIRINNMDDATFDKFYADQYGYADIEDAEERKIAREKAREEAQSEAIVESMAFMAGMKMTPLISHPKTTLAKMRANIAELRAINNRRGYTFGQYMNEKLSASPADVLLTREELREVEKYYGKASGWFKRTEKSEGESGVVTEDMEIMQEDGTPYQFTNISDFGVEEISDGGDRSRFDGYDIIDQIVGDARLPQSIRAKVGYIVTGQLMPMGTIMGYRETVEDTGGITIESLTAEGEVVTSRNYKSKKQAEIEKQNIIRQARLNSIDVGEKFAEQEAENLAVEEAYDEVAESYGVIREGIENIYKRHLSGEKLSDKETEIVEDLKRRSSELSDNYKSYKAEAIRGSVEKETGVTIDEALRKQESELTEQERDALNVYAERLYKEAENLRQAREVWGKEAEAWNREEREARVRAWRMQRDGKLLKAQEEARGNYEKGKDVYDRQQQGDEQAQAELEEITARMQDATENLRDVFGGDYEETMSALDERPWDVLISPELTPEQRDAVLYYINSRSALEGVLGASADAAERKRQEIARDVEQRTHKDSGVILPATMKIDDKQVYIVKGDVKMFDDGSRVDVANSSDYIIVFNPEVGKMESASPEMIHKVDAPIDPKAELDTALQSIEGEGLEYREGRGLHTAQWQRGYDGADDIRGASDKWLQNALAQFDQAEQAGEIIDDYVRGRHQALRDEIERRKKIESAERESSELREKIEGESLNNEKNSLNLQKGEDDGLSDERNRERDDAADNREAEPLARAIYALTEGRARAEGESGRTSSYRDASESNSDGTRIRAAEEDARLAERFAKESGMWVPINDVIGLGEPGQSGNESDTYHAGNSIYKVNNLMNNGGSVLSLLHRVQLHNEIFPNTAYELYGFTGIDGRSVYPILKQQLVENADYATVEEIDAYMQSRGFEKVGDYTYRKGRYEVSDLRPRNVLKDADGEIYVIDADIKERETALSRIPVNATGKEQWTAVEAPIAWNGLVGKIGDEDSAGEFARMQVDRVKKDVSRLEKQKPKMTADADEFKAANDKRKAAIASAKEELAKWEAIADVPEAKKREAEAAAQVAGQARLEEERKAEAERKEREAAEAQERAAMKKVSAEYAEVYDEVKDCDEAVEVLKRLDPESVDEVAAYVLSRYKVLWGDKRSGGASGHLLRQGARRASGLGEAERKRLFGIFASEANGGKSLQTLAEDIFKQVCRDFGVPYDNQVAEQALIDMLRDSQKASDIKQYIKRKRMQQALEIKSAFDKRQEEAEEEYYLEAYGMSKAEYIAYEERVHEEVKELAENFDEREYNGNIADEIAERQKQEAAYREQQAAQFAEIEKRLKDIDIDNQRADEDAQNKGIENESDGNDRRAVSELAQRADANGEGTGDGRGSEILLGQGIGEQGRGTPNAGRPGVSSGAGSTVSDTQNGVSAEASGIEASETPIQGLESYTRDEIKEIVLREVENRLNDAEIYVEIVGIEIHGSRNRGNAREDSDLDVVVEYDGDFKEDDMFNAIHEEPIEIEGINVDVNPIRADQSGTLEEYMERSRRYDEEVLKEQEPTNGHTIEDQQDNSPAESEFTEVENGIGAVIEWRTAKDAWANHEAKHLFDAEDSPGHDEVVAERKRLEAEIESKRIAMEEALVKMDDNTFAQAVEASGLKWPEGPQGMWERYKKIENQKKASSLFDNVKLINDIEPEKNKKFNLIDVSAKADPERLRGVYHDSELGMAIATDTALLVASKADYDKGNADKLVDKKGNEIRVVLSDTQRYPKVSRVIPKGAPEQTVALSSAKIEKLSGQISGILKGMKATEAERQAIAVHFPNGEIGIYNARRLGQFLGGMRHIGEYGIETFGVNRPIAARGAGGVVLLMPLHPEGAGGFGKYGYDLGYGIDLSGKLKSFQRLDVNPQGTRISDSQGVIAGKGSEKDSEKQIEEGGNIVNEPRGRYGRNRGKMMTGRSLFDFEEAENTRVNGDKEGVKWAQKELDLEGGEAPTGTGSDFVETTARAEAANIAIDEFVDKVGEYYRGLEELRNRTADERLTSEERAEAEGMLQQHDEFIEQERERLRESLRDFYAENNSVEDAEMLSRQMAARVEAEAEIKLNREQMLRDLLTKAPVANEGRQIAEIAKIAAEVKESEGQEVKTAGGLISYNAVGHLPDAKKGEFAYVERKFSMTGEFGFTGSEIIKDRGDVAYIFRALEDYSIENVFVVYVKDGKAKIQHLGMGGPAMSPAWLGGIRAGYDAFGADKVYLVHNHPSGNLMASEADMGLMRQIESWADGKIETEGIIMDTTSGRYRSFDGNGAGEIYDRPREGGEKGVDVLRFDRMKEDIEGLKYSPKISAPKQIVDFINGLREGADDKVSYLVLSQNYKIVGNFHTGYEGITDDGLAEEMASTATKFGGQAVVVYGNGGIAGSGSLQKAVDKASLGGVKLIDALQIEGESSYKSAVDYGLINEPETKYGEDVETVNARFNEELEKYKAGELPNSHRFDLGMPSEYLESAGFPKLPISMRSTLLGAKASMNRHPFDPAELQGLVKALQKPIAVFEYSKDNMRNVIVDITHNNKHFLVGVTLNYKVGELEINSVSGLFPKDNIEWLKWIQQGKAIRIDQKEKVQAIIDSQRTTNTVESERIGLNLDDVAKVVKEFENPKLGAENFDTSNSPEELSDSRVQFSIRTEAAPKKTGIGYKVFYLKDGKLYPPMVANPNGESTPVGVWLNADAAPVAGQSKTGRLQVKAGGKGTQGGSGSLAYRPGWHLGEIPYALQFNRKGESGVKDEFPSNFVWAEVEYANDVDYQEEAMAYGINASGKFQHSLAGLPKLPENGSYRYRTNPNPETDPWIITGAMKVNRLLTPTEVDEMVMAAGREPQKRQSGSVSDAEIEKLNSQIASQTEETQSVKREVVRAMTEMLEESGVPVHVVDSAEVAKMFPERGKEGRKIAGWTKDGKVYINKDAVQPDTPLHEYTHLWDDMVKKENPELWERGKGLLKESPEWKKVMEDPEYADIRDDEDAIASEVHSRLTGKDGARIMDEWIKEARKHGPIEEAKAVSLIERLKRWFLDVFKNIKSTLSKWSGKDLKKLTLEDFNRMTVRDFMEGLNPNKEMWRGEAARDGEQFDFSKDRTEFDAMRERAVAEGGIVMPDLADKEVEVTQVPRHNFEGSGKEALKKAEAWAKENLSGVYKLTDASGASVDYTISNKAIEKYVSPSATGKSANIGVHLSVLKELPNVIANSIEAEVHPDYQKNGKGERDASLTPGKDTVVHRFYGAVELGGETYRVKTTIYEKKGDKNIPHSYEVTEIETLDARPSAMLASKGQNKNSTLGTTNVGTNSETRKISGKELLNGVEKSYDKGKKLLDESESTERFQIVEEPDAQYGEPQEQSAQGSGETARFTAGADGDIFDQAARVAGRARAQARKEAKRRQAQRDTIETLNDIRAQIKSANADRLADKKEKVRALGGKIGKLRQAMARQKEYDVATAKAIKDMAHDMLEAGLLDALGTGEMKRLLSAEANAVGKNDISKQVDTVVDIMLDNYLRNLEGVYGKMLSTKGKKVDSRGVEVMGSLDADGQRVLDAVKRNQGLSVDEIDKKIDEALERMDHKDRAIADEAALEYAGLLLAREYAETITQSKADEKALRESIKHAEDEKRAGTMTAKEFREYKKAVEEAIRQNKTERAEAYEAMLDKMGGALNESAERAREWREAEQRRVEEIQHNANSDMQGRTASLYKKMNTFGDKTLKFAAHTLLRPLVTFEQFMKVLGRKSADGKGYLYQCFVPQFSEAAGNEWKGYRAAINELNDKVASVFGKKKMKWTDLYKYVRKLPKAEVKLNDFGGETTTVELDQGHLMYIYMVDKMNDGRMKLRRMGITEEVIQDIANKLDPELVELADWIQEEFLPGKRSKYNEVYKRMFGTSMPAIENYFPLKILKRSLETNPEEQKQEGQTTVSAETTGAWKKRTRNTNPLDLQEANAIAIVVEHIKEMEKAAAFAELARDLNTLRRYKRFRNQVRNMRTAYGSGEDLLKTFDELCAMTTGDYKPEMNPFDKMMMKPVAMVTAAKVAYRLFTAFKQVASFPAFLAECNPVDFVWSATNIKGTWDWAMKNMPVFEKRFKGKVSGDPVLMRLELEGGATRWKRFKGAMGRNAMAANAFVDALTCAVGARAVYLTNMRKYERLGFKEEEAHRRAIADAQISFNLSQQSGEGAFLSQIQANRSFFSTIFTVFRNASMSYSRQVYDAMRNLGRRLEPGYGKSAIEFRTKQWIREGVDPEVAAKEARKEYRQGFAKESARLAIFAYVLPALWYIVNKLPFILFSNDKEAVDEEIGDALTHGFFGSVEGLLGGDAISDALHSYFKDEPFMDALKKEMPALQDWENIKGYYKTDKMRGLNEAINLLVSAGFGTNIQVLEDAVAACIEFSESDREMKEFAFMLARIAQMPQSQLDKVYFEELDMTGTEASSVSPRQLIDRYVEYKMLREAPLTGWLRSDEEREAIKEKKTKKLNKDAKERITKRMQRPAVAALLAEHEATGKRWSELRELSKTDPDAFRREWVAFREEHNLWVYNRVGQYKRDTEKLYKQWVDAKTAAEAREAVDLMISAQDKLMEDVDNIRASRQ